MPGGQQQERHRHQRLVPVGALRAAGEDLPAEQVPVIRVLLLAGHQVVEVGGDRQDGVLPVLAGRPRVHHRRGVPLEELVVVVGDAQQLADHQRRHRQRQLAHQVRGPGPGEHGVDPLVHDRLHPRPQRLHPAHRELPEHRPPSHPVLGRVHRRQRLPTPWPHPPTRHQPRVVRVVPVGAEPRIGQHRPHVLVPRHRPRPPVLDQADLGDGLLLPDPRVLLGREERACPGHGEVLGTDPGYVDHRVLLMSGQPATRVEGRVFVARNGDSGVTGTFSVATARRV
ncbi:hypothetical protein CLV43_10792 [Umezawaea tangerina]|uniref:Uncharacterized protein n=1 Tax=Umezawaea tangerina TaxID=84725 RepID=A0A2T0T1I3_9PSEU|nr:hypothetical protein CLV43_10792 [Umezawaea tangerina]